MAPQYRQKFRAEYKQHKGLKAWISEDPKDPYKAFCKYCKCHIKCKMYDLIAHTTTRKHKECCSILYSTPKLPFAPQDYSTKLQEAAMCMFICQHTSINTTDHLTDLCKSCFKDTLNVKLHRSKCSNVIRNVLWPHFRLELRKDIGDSKYSLLIDESTDISITKYLGKSLCCFKVYLLTNFHFQEL